MTSSLCDAVRIVHQTTDYLDDKYRMLGAPRSHEEAVRLCALHTTLLPQWQAVDIAAVAGELEATKTLCRTLINAYRHVLQW